MPDDDLTALARLADIVAVDLLSHCPPDEWPTSAVVKEMRVVARRLRDARRALPASLVEVVERAEG